MTNDQRAGQAGRKIVHMVLLSLLLSAVAVPIAAALCLGFAALVRRLGYRSSDQRVTAKDQRWLSRQARHSGS